MGILGQMLLSAWALESPFLAWSELSLLLSGFLPIHLLLYEPSCASLGRHSFFFQCTFSGSFGGGEGISSALHFCYPGGDYVHVYVQ